MTHPTHDSIPSAPEEVLSTLRQDGTRRWLYPVLTQGLWLKRRRVVGWALIALYFLCPIVPIGGQPAVWLDVIHQRFIILGQIFHATDVMLLMLLGITSLFALVWITSIFGRVWCGWGCPQTVYLEFIFRPIERLIEGSESKRRKLDTAQHDNTKVLKKVIKYTLFGLVSAAMAHTFVAYFVSWGLLLEWMTQAPKQHWGIFVLTFGLTGLVLFNFAYFREQMCSIICPYAKLQSVLLDQDSLTVVYDTRRGEPRGRRKKGQENILGDCVDCGACVRTCPAGIDIREGLQMECVGCTQCIDACDQIMDRLGQPGGLIRYASERSLEGKKTQWIRPRVLIYTAILTLCIGLLTWGVNSSSGVEVDIVRATGAPFMKLPDGQVANRFKIRILNRTPDTKSLAFEVTQPKGATLKVVGAPIQKIKTDDMTRVEVWITSPQANFKRGTVPTVIQTRDTKTGKTRDFPFVLIGPES